MARKHCSICGRFGHVASAHPHRNPEFYTDDQGRVRPIRGSVGRGWKGPSAGPYDRAKAHEKPLRERRARPERRKIRRVTGRGYRSLSR